jgi:protein TonB
VTGAEYGPYLAQVRQLIQDTLRYPPAALRRGVTGIVHLELAIAATGRISSASVVTSSSHETLDRAAVEAARSLPRVPFPKDIRAVPLTVRIPIVFELR